MRVKSRLSRPRTVISQPRAGQRQWRILDRPAVVSAKELRGNGDERYARDKGSEGTQRDPFEGHQWGTRGAAKSRCGGQESNSCAETRDNMAGVVIVKGGSVTIKEAGR